MNAQWLLIGGPADGKVVSIKHGRSVIWDGGDGKRYEYKETSYLYRGRMYRLGCFDPGDVEPGKVERMIEEAGLHSIDGD